MNVRLNQHSEELLRQQMAQGGFRSPEEVIERALELLDTSEHASRQDREGQQKAVREMLDFVKRNRVHLGADLTVKDLIHEGHRV